MIEQSILSLFGFALLLVAGCGGEPEAPSADSRVLTDVPQIVSQFKSSNWQIRSLAANRLGMLGAEAAAALPDLERLQSNDPDERVRVAAKNAIARIKAPPKR